MFRYLFAFIVFVHGLIHLMGFVKAFGLAEISQLTQAISKPRGILWLICAILFCTSMIVFLAKANWWWMLVIPAVLMSQVLIFIYWQDAKFGTIANVIALLVGVWGYGEWSFVQASREKVAAMMPAALEQLQQVNRQMLAQLPPLVQGWMESSGILGKEMIQTVHLYQKGEMRTSAEGAWMPVDAEQWFSIQPPAFIWMADVGGSGLMQFRGRDMYREGSGQMLIKAYSMLPVVDMSATPEINQGTLVRYLSEIIWFPSAALAPYIRWEQLNARQAKASMRYGDVTAYGIFGFDENGRMISFEAPRYYDRPEGATLEDWFINIDPDSYRTFEGIRIPTQGTVTWKLEDGDYTWYKLEITEVKYNVLP